MPFLTQRSITTTIHAHSAKNGGMTRIAKVLAPSRAAPIVQMMNPKTASSQPFLSDSLRVFNSSMPALVHLTRPKPKAPYCRAQGAQRNLEEPAGGKSERPAHTQ